MSLSTIVEYLFYFSVASHESIFLKTCVLKLAKELRVCRLSRHFPLLQNFFSRNIKVVQLTTNPALDPRNEEQR